MQNAKKSDHFRCRRAGTGNSRCIEQKPIISAAIEQGQAPSRFEKTRRVAAAFGQKKGEKPLPGVEIGISRYKFAEIIKS